jgi:hypothetical protein
MRAKLAYHRPMRYWTLVFTLCLAGMFALSAQAQLNGPPPSVTSPGFGGRQFNGVPPSVTSPGFGGRPINAVPPSVTSPGFSRPPQHPTGVHSPGQHPGSSHHQHGAYGYPYYVPYYPVTPYDSGDAPDDQASADAPDQYQGGPTIFDRRGPGTPRPNDYVSDPPPRAHVPRPDPAPPDDADAANDPPAAPPAAEPNTILVFKDGHKVEVGNYAIVGTNLFDLTPGHRQRVALTDLDVAATQKANDDLGVDFKLPAFLNGN